MSANDPEQTFAAKVTNGRSAQKAGFAKLGRGLCLESKTGP